MDLTSEQGAVVEQLDRMIAGVGDAFDAFVKAADECERLHVPGEILQAKALQLQGEITRRMMGGMVPA